MIITNICEYYSEKYIKRKTHIKYIRNFQELSQIIWIRLNVDVYKLPNVKNINTKLVDNFHI